MSENQRSESADKTRHLQRISKAIASPSFRNGHYRCLSHSRKTRGNESKLASTLETMQEEGAASRSTGPLLIIPLRKHYVLRPNFYELSLRVILISFLCLICNGGTSGYERSQFLFISQPERINKHSRRRGHRYSSIHLW
jgi:hypothetical protein